jgi:hypothetical protein
MVAAGAPVSAEKGRVRALVGACSLLCSGAVVACGESLGEFARKIENVHYVVAFRAEPDPIEVGTHFSLDFAVCPRNAAVAARSVRVDARMPEHQHGMNYRPVVVTRAPGAYHADGLMFHMPGRWELYFDVVTESGSERLTATLQLE